MNSRLSAAGELVHSLFVVRLVGRWNSIVLVVVVVVRVTFVVVFLVGVFVGCNIQRKNTVVTFMYIKRVVTPNS